MKVAIGCDHIVTGIKNHIGEYLKAKGFEVVDCGTYDYERTHYPIYGKRVAEQVVTGQCDLGVVLCGTGVGITNAVQKVKGARCALVGDVSAAVHAKEQLNCNVLGVGGRVSGIGMIEDILDAYFNAEYVPTPEKEATIAKIDALIQRDDYIGDDHFFDEFLEKWDRGEYHD
ncbi:MAG: galactose-6-phosphate isomerase subunit LacB [Bacillota bacterium]|nr:galactose-6-phosphate isomerase subunit LacB [Bacillota bacterium]